jgi:hypothetical protein
MQDLEALPAGPGDVVVDHELVDGRLLEILERPAAAADAFERLVVEPGAAEAVPVGRADRPLDRRPRGF